MTSNKLKLILVLMLLCVFSSCNMNDSQKESKEINKTIKGNWLEAVTNRVFIIEDTTIQVLNTMGKPYDEGSYSIEKNVIKIVYTRYHGLLIGGELIETFEYILNDNKLVLILFDEDGNKATPIYLTKQ